MKYQWLSFVGLLIFAALRFAFIRLTGRFATFKEDLILVAIATCIILFGVFSYAAIHPKAFQYRPPARSVARPKQSPALSLQLSQQESEAIRRLINLLYGDHEAAKRLVIANWERNPDRPLQWVIEKTIEDLIRDRSR